MKKRIIVISLGGSLIVPDKVDTGFLGKFRKVIMGNTNKYKFIIVCGGGSVARKYISALEESGANPKLQSLAGISATRMNARFMSYFFGLNPERGIPHRMKEIKKYLKRQDVVFCGALEYKPNQTSDSTSAEIAEKFNSDFINLTDVSGLYDKNPKKFKDAKFIPEISWGKFNSIANKMKFIPGQHFVLDQTASGIIMKKRIKTYILGKNLNNLDALLKGKKFMGSVIGR